KVELFSGTVFGHVQLAVGDFAKKNKVLLVRWASVFSDQFARENRYTFSALSAFLYAEVLADVVLHLPQKKWDKIAHNYAYGKSVIQFFKAALSKKRPDIQWMGEFWPAIGKLDAGAVVSAINNINPDAIFDITYTRDLSMLIRQGKARNLWKDRMV